MKSRKFIATALTVLLLLSLQLAAAKSKPATEKKQGQFFIAPEVAAVFAAGVSTRTNRGDIPMTYLRTLYLPAQQDQIYPVFLFQMKNADLNFSAQPETPGVLKAKHMAFIRVYRMENGLPGAIVKERNIHFDLEENQQGFQPDALNYYSIAGDIYPPGSYLLALAVSTADFAKIAACYTEFSLPDFAGIKDKLVTTPVFSVRDLQMMQAAETKLLIHKNSFVYNTLLLAPDLKNEFKANENLDLFYFIIGAKPDSASKALNLQATYKFNKDGKEVNKMAPQTVNSPIISQPIAFTFTEVTKNDKGVETERQEKLLEPGNYVLEIEILDNVSQAKGLQEFTFKIVL